MHKRINLRTVIAFIGSSENTPTLYTPYLRYSKLKEYIKVVQEYLNEKNIDAIIDDNLSELEYQREYLTCYYTMSEENLPAHKNFFIYLTSCKDKFWPIRAMNKVICSNIDEKIRKAFLLPEHIKVLSN